MALQRTNIDFKNNGKDIKYLNKDFAQFRQNLIEFTKAYFPKTYADFNESSPGMLFIELASYIGDVLSYYTDDTLKESLILHADDIENVIALARYLGYTPKVTSPSVTTISVYQIVPSIGSGAENEMDIRYLLNIKQGMILESNSGIRFATTDAVDFSDASDREVTIYERSPTTGEITYYLVKKYVNAISAQIVTQDFVFGDYEPFKSINLLETNVIDIYDVRDSNGNKYYQVPYLAQEMVFVDYPNTQYNDDLYQFKASAPYILKTLKTSRRFTVSVNPDRTTTIKFGAGDPSINDELIVPNLKNVGLGLPNSVGKLGEAFDPTNFLKTKTYGSSPSNTTITVKYMVGGGVASNVAKGEITKIRSIEFDDDIELFTDAQKNLYNQIRNSVAVDNEVPATGGGGFESIDEVRENALANFGSQNRAVTAKDYEVRCLSMPAKYGSIAKVYATADGALDTNSPETILYSANYAQEFSDLVMSYIKRSGSEEIDRRVIQKDIQQFLLGKTNNIKEKNNPFAINLYVLGYDANNKLAPLNSAVKENVKTYLNEYRMLTDGINILDGFVINIGIDFEILAFRNYNKSEVVSACIQELKSYFDVSKWTFNNIININEIELLLANIEGVNSVSKLHFYNKCGGAYSSNAYDIGAATRDKLIYPSLDPSIFEVKYPNNDIRGRAK